MKQRPRFMSVSRDSADQVARCATYGRQQLAQKIHPSQIRVEDGEVSRVVVRNGHDPERGRRRSVVAHTASKVKVYIPVSLDGNVQTS